MLSTAAVLIDINCITEFRCTTAEFSYTVDINEAKHLRSFKEAKNTKRGGKQYGDPFLCFGRRGKIQSEIVLNKDILTFDPFKVYFEIQSETILYKTILTFHPK